MDYQHHARLMVHGREQICRAVVEGLSRQSAAKWVRRYREHGVAGLADRRSRPQRLRQPTSAELVERVQALRRFVGAINQLIRKISRDQNFYVVLVDMIPASRQKIILRGLDYFTVPMAPHFLPVSQKLSKRHLQFDPERWKLDRCPVEMDQKWKWIWHNNQHRRCRQGVCRSGFRDS